MPYSTLFCLPCAVIKFAKDEAAWKKIRNMPSNKHEKRLEQARKMAK